MRSRNGSLTRGPDEHQEFNRTDDGKGMTTILNNVLGDILGFLRKALADGTLNPNTVAGIDAWDSSFQSEMSATKPKLPALSSSDRSLPLALRLQALEAELAAFDKALPYIPDHQFIETDSIS